MILVVAISKVIAGEVPHPAIIYKTHSKCSTEIKRFSCSMVKGRPNLIAYSVHLVIMASHDFALHTVVNMCMHVTLGSPTVLMAS